MKQRFVWFLCLIVVGCFLFGCDKYSGNKHRKTAEGFNEDLTGSVDEWVLYRSADFSIQFPPIFKLDTSGYRKSLLILCSELTEDGDLFKDNIAVMVEDKKDNLSLEDFGKRSEGYIIQYTDSSEILESGLKKRNGQEYYQIIYSENQTGFRLIREQQIIFSGQKIYNLSLTCEDAVFDQCREVGEAIMSTFTLH